jgi:hypothetical protein
MLGKDSQTDILMKRKLAHFSWYSLIKYIRQTKVCKI